MSCLDAEVLESLRRRLLDAKAAVLELLAQSRSASGKVEASGQTIGRLTRMDALQVQAMSALSQHQLDIRRQQIEASLLAFDEGTYGICRACREAVGRARLEVVPEAPFCLDCQERFETER